MKKDGIKKLLGIWIATDMTSGAVMLGKNSEVYRLCASLAFILHIFSLLLSNLFVNIANFIAKYQR